MLCACGGSSPGSSPTPSSGSGSSSASGSEDSDGPGTRDNTPKVLVPSADGTVVYSCDVATIDASNSSEGYVMVSYTGSNAKVKLQITCPDSVTYTYNLHSGYEVFPLTAGNGSYSLSIYESVDIEANKYATAFSQTIDVSIDNEFGPFLYPNDYVDFTKDSLPVAKAEELAYSADTDLDVVASVYNYMIENFTYDYDKADTVQSGYIPVVDDVFQSKTGICFDYASVTATMLRSQGIPTRLEVGYKGDIYHAWISTYIKDVGWINGVIEFDGTEWHLLDPTFASTSSSPQKFIMEESDYITKFVY
jgi:transglutaminase-like putative cysteine protease